MKVIFKINKPMEDYTYFKLASRIRDLWDRTRDLDCMVVPEEVEVYVVESDSEVEIDDKMSEM